MYVCLCCGLRGGVGVDVRCMQERRKVLRFGGSIGFDRINLHGKNLIPMEKL